MFDPDLWRVLGVHWHGYVEIDRGDPWWAPRSRAELLRLPPAKVLLTPDAASDWVSEMTAAHALPVEVRLVGAQGPHGGVGILGDDGHREHDSQENHVVLSRGDSLRYDFPREGDRLHLRVEAVTARQCAVTHPREDQES